MIENIWAIPLFPLIAFVLLLAGRNVFQAKTATWVGSLSAFLSFLGSVAALWVQLSEGNHLSLFPWLSFGETTIRFGIELNQLNVLMMILVSLISFLVQVYSHSYMKGDQRVPIFHAYLSLFTFSMLGLVLSPNLLQLYIFWELVGVCSFLLIGYWYFKPEAKRAAQKAFIVTRIGDVGLLIAVILTLLYVGNLELTTIFASLDAGEIPPGMVTLIALLVFVGAVGKSGQFPLHTWLPDAMEGPTPVSALIHAATMVAAGVFLVARMFPLFQSSSVAMDTVAWTGAFTAIFAAGIGLVQYDIKRVLAYSTISQLGYMMFALGAGGYVAGIFHLMTHGVFKALLFLVAGAIIIVFNHEQDLRRMGGLWKTHPTLGWFFVIGCLSIAGIPPFSGFFSKEEVLLAAFADGRMGIFILGIVTAFLTAFYMFRLFFLAFWGKSSIETRGKTVASTMIWPMGVLALLSILAGFVEVPGHHLSFWLREGSDTISGKVGEASIWVAFFSIAVSLAGIILAWAVYANKSIPRDLLQKPFPWLYSFLHRKCYVDEMQRAIVVEPYRMLGFLLSAFDRYIVQGIVHLVAGIPRFAGAIVTRLQNGQAQTYALVSVIGLVLLIIGLTAGRLFG
ncbi:NADH-quinone oxidoreductase subunit L [Melghirimyces algeriensis]|uniref:NADH-quinone oxidoreductase subunit L n=1 Tax=Melghirimyces algeriensis TaxID=910412 RepID=A0A521D5Z0_9BACL|nr:NADH-quinone oxidoreductase subunit L [Melghirimyces algeriensis]SMO67126.1 NADH-quinone oxidoreductase subunit L [Melghirimyces algeriensis]